MTEETRMLREALQDCCTVLKGIRMLPTEQAAEESRNGAIDAVLTQAQIALSMNRRWDSTRQIDLRIIQKQLDQIESVLTMAHHLLDWRGVTTPGNVKAVGDAIDTLITVKQSFGLINYAKPVEERESAVISQEEQRS